VGARKSRKMSWELKTRMPTLAAASYSAECYMSVPHAQMGKIKKEGREFSVYIAYDRPKIKQWGKH
jgi:hypothetical protein